MAAPPDTTPDDSSTTARTYLHVQPSDDPIDPAAVARSVTRLHHIDAGGFMEADTAPTYELMFVATGESGADGDRHLDWYVGADTDALDTLEGALRGCLPQSADLEPVDFAYETALGLPQLGDTESVETTYSAQTSPRDYRLDMPGLTDVFTFEHARDRPRCSRATSGQVTRFRRTARQQPRPDDVQPSVGVDGPLQAGRDAEVASGYQTWPAVCPLSTRRHLPGMWYCPSRLKPGNTLALDHLCPTAPPWSKRRCSPRPAAAPTDPTHRRLQTRKHPEEGLNQLTVSPSSRPCTDQSTASGAGTTPSDRTTVQPAESSVHIGDISDREHTV